MTDPKDVANEAYGFWAKAARWVGDHPRTTLGAAMIVTLVLLGFALH